MVGKVGVLLITLFIGSLALRHGSENDIDLTIHTDTSARIVGGVEAPIGSAPYMVALTNGLLIRSYLCGGSIVGLRHILTAAHCIAAVFSRGSLSNSLRATVGTNRWNQGGHNYNLARNITHPHHVGSTYKNDIGILITTEDFLFFNLVAVVPLSYDQVDAGVVTRAAGWGRTRANGAFSSPLLQITLPVIDGQRCVAEVAQASIDFNIRAPAVEPHIEICTYHSPGHGTCQGDSGSALVRVDNGHQVGVVAWGFPCARGAPDMFVRLSVYRDWLFSALV